MNPTNIIIYNMCKETWCEVQETIYPNINVLFDDFYPPTYFTKNPEALEQIANGEIPDYWNVENTAGRMFKIVTVGVTEETNRESFYTKALDFINRAYDEVKEMIGIEFPSLVQQTKESLLNGLEQYKNGVDIKDIIFE